MLAAPTRLLLHTSESCHMVQGRFSDGIRPASASALALASSSSYTALPRASSAGKLKTNTTRLRPSSSQPGRPKSAAAVRQRPAALLSRGALKATSIGFGGSSSSTSQPGLSQPSVIPATQEFSRGQLVGGLARATSSANEKAEFEAFAWQASVQSRSQGGAALGSSHPAASLGSDRPADLLTPEETLRSFESLEGDIQELKKHVRMEGFDENTAAHRDDLRRAEERRKREERERKLRDRTRETKDPRRRVNAMLEQGREFGQVRPDHVRDARRLRVPVQNHHSIHNHGAERIEMVNVQALQALCTGLQQGCTSYEAIKERADEHEKQKKWLESTLPPPERRKDFVKENMVPTSHLVSKKSTKQSQSDLKQLQASKRRSDASEVNALTTLEQLRNTWRMEADASGRHCCNREVAQALQQMSAAAQSVGLEIPEYLKYQGKLREEMERKKFRGYGSISIELADAGGTCENHVVNENKQKRESKELEVILSTPQRSAPTSPTSELTPASPQSLNSRGDLFGSRSASPKGAKSSLGVGRGAISFSENLRRKMEVQRHQNALRSRVRKLWAIIKAIRRLLFLRVLFRRREQAQPVLANFLKSVMEQNVLKRAIHSYVCRIVAVQKRIRSFQANKRIWCEKASEKWRHVEDRHLEACARAKEKERRLQEEDRPRAAGKKGSSATAGNSTSGLSGRQATLDSADMPNPFKIPKKKRMFTLARYYNFLCKHSRQQFETLCDVIRIRCGEHADLEAYFKKFDFEVDLKKITSGEQGAGLDQATIPRAASVDTQGSSLISEAEVLELIGIAAFELRHETRFKDHPANVGLDAEEAGGQISGRFRRIIQLISGKVDAGPASRRETVPVWGSSSSSTAKSKVVSADEVPGRPLDVDALMEKFSPRFLQEVAAAEVAAKEDAEEVSAARSSELRVGADEFAAR